MAYASETLPSPPEIEPTTYEDVREQIRRRAYELYELRGREDGHDLEDWLQAQSELLPALELELLKAYSEAFIWRSSHHHETECIP